MIATANDMCSRSLPKFTTSSPTRGSEPPCTSWKIVGMRSATTASSSIDACAWAPAALNVCFFRLSPPTNIARPMTSRMLPRIEPISDAFTTSCRPSRSAKKAMTSSGKLPNVTFSRPPIPGPVRAASSSVALPMSAAVGITPSAAATKITVALECPNSSAIAIGMNGTSR